MIVKIERYEQGQKFWLVDGFKKVSVSSNLISRIEHERNLDDVSIYDYWNSQEQGCGCSGEREQCSNCCTCVRLICRNEEGDEVSIVFDTIAYILNDNGKTVEKVVANYPDLKR